MQRLTHGQLAGQTNLKVILVGAFCLLTTQSEISNTEMTEQPLYWLLFFRVGIIAYACMQELFLLSLSHALCEMIRLGY